MSYRPAFVAQLEALGFDPSRNNTVKIENPSPMKDFVPKVAIVGVGTMIATQLVLRARFGNI